MKKRGNIFFLFNLILFAISAVSAGGARKEDAAAKEKVINFINSAGGPAAVPAISPPYYIQLEYAKWPFVYDTLVANDESLAPVRPKLAKTWDIEKDGKTVTFHLRDDVTFHDGEKFTAEDVKFTIEFQCHPDTPAREKIVNETPFGTLVGYKDYIERKASHISGIEILDDYTVRFTMEEPNGVFMLGIAISPVLPEHRLKNINYAEMESAPEFAKPIGTGPFKIVEVAPDQYYKYVAYNNYWDGRPKIDVVYQRSLDLEMALQSGDVDLAYTRDLDIVKTAEAKEYKLVEIPAIRTQCFRMNTARSPFNDKNFRLAIIHAIDRDALIDNFFDGRAKKTTAYMGPGFWHNDKLPVRKYNPELAKEYLAKSNYDGSPIDLTYYYTDQATKDMIAAIQHYWKEVGIDSESRLVDSPTANTIVYKEKTFHIMYAARAYADPAWLSSYKCGADTNYTGWCSEEFDRLVDKARLSTDINERQRLYYAAEKIMYDEVIDHPLFAPNIVNIFSPRLKVTSKPVPGLWYPVDLQLHKWDLNE